MDKEIDQLLDKRCWRLVRRSDLPPGTQAVPGRWVFKKKELDGIPIQEDYQAKARWVIRGNLLEKDFMESYAPVVNDVTNCLLMAIAAP